MPLGGWGSAACSWHGWQAASPLCGLPLQKKGYVWEASWGCVWVGRDCASEAYKLVLFGQVSSQAFAGVGVRLVLLFLEGPPMLACWRWKWRQVAYMANVACRQIGFEFGVVSPAGCAEYGGASFCGASGSPVAAKAMQCAGTEMSLKECKHDAPDDACLSHASDSVVFCGASTTSAFFDGELRLIGASGAPVLRHEVGRLEMYLAHTQAWAPVCRQGFTSGSATVACKTMGFVVVLQGFLRAAQATCAERCRLMFRL